LASCAGNPLTLNPKNTYFDKFPTLKDIVVSFDKLRTKFQEIGTNFTEIFIYDNPVLKRDPEDDRWLDRAFFEANVPALDLSLVARLRLSQFFENGFFMTRDRLNVSTGCNFSLASYLRLRTSLVSFRNSQQNLLANNINSGKNISELFGVEKKRFKKTSHNFKQSNFIGRQNYEIANCQNLF
jgi:hypothetical protein